MQFKVKFKMVNVKYQLEQSIKKAIFKRTFYMTCDVFLWQGYQDKVDEPEMRHLVPDAVRSKKDILFGNLKDIYRFHKELVF